MASPTTPTAGRAGVLAATLAVVAAAGCWGIAAIMAKVGFEHGVSPGRMAEARAAVALAVLAPLLAWRRRDLLRPPTGSLPVLLAFGGCSPPASPGCCWAGGLLVVAGVVLAQLAQPRSAAAPAAGGSVPEAVAPTEPWNA